MTPGRGCGPRRSRQHTHHSGPAEGLPPRKAQVPGWRPRPVHLCVPVSQGVRPSARPRRPRTGRRAKPRARHPLPQTGPAGAEVLPSTEPRLRNVPADPALSQACFPACPPVPQTAAVTTWSVEGPAGRRPPSSPAPTLPCKSLHVLKIILPAKFSSGFSHQKNMPVCSGGVSLRGQGSTVPHPLWRRGN